LRAVPITSQPGTIRWSPARKSRSSASRWLFFNEESIRVWDLNDPSWTATINNGSGGMGKIFNAEFGRTRNEVLVFSDFGSKLTVWSLATGRNVEIRDPKFSNSRGHEYRNTLGILALLARPGAQDMLTLHAPNSYRIIKSVALPTMDAQGLKWSPNEKWIAVWDTSSLGQKVYIFTADGNLFRTYTGTDDAGVGGIGIRSLEWSPAGQYLAISGTDRRVILLGTRTFSPVIYLDHSPSIQLLDKGQVWQEQVTAASKRSYQVVPQPFSPPTISSPTQNGVPKTGVAQIAFNSSGSMAATKDDSTPTAVWLWDLASLSAAAVLIHHSPVRQLSWHPSRPHLLLITCVTDDAVLHIWNNEKKEPEATSLPLHRSESKFDIRWLGDESACETALLVTSSQKALVFWPEGKSQAPIDSVEEGDESLDSVYEALVGRSAKRERIMDSTEMLVSDITEDFSDVLDDTFVGRKQMGLAI
jgi:WD40 repeat protein